MLLPRLDQGAHLRDEAEDDHDEPARDADEAAPDAGHADEADILAALDGGLLSAVSLDVFQQEPLPSDSPFWTHPKVTITPHAAAASDPYALVQPIVDQMEAFDRGEALKNLVDRKHQY